MLQYTPHSPSLEHPSTSIDNFYPLSIIPTNPLQTFRTPTPTFFVNMSAAFNPVSTFPTSMSPSLLGPLPIGTSASLVSAPIPHKCASI